MPLLSAYGNSVILLEALPSPPIWVLGAVLTTILLIPIGGIFYYFYNDPYVTPHSKQPLEEQIKLALWASGEQFWDYDLVEQKLYYMFAGTDTASGKVRIHHLYNHELIVHPSDKPKMLRALQNHLQGDTSLFISEHRLDVAANGKWVWLHVRGHIVERDSKGVPTRLAGTARDITATRRDESELRIAGEVLHGMSEAVAVLDPDFKFVSVNPAFVKITGYDESEVLGRDLFILDSRNLDAEHYDRLHHELDQVGYWHGEMWKIRKNGDEMLCRVKNTAIRDSDNELIFHVVVLEDITEQKHAEQELRYLANYDTLTHLPNRTLLSQQLAEAIAHAKQTQSGLAVLFLDLDRFKLINDSLGHSIGDRVLRAVAERTKQTVGAEHIVARLSGDEFTVVLKNIQNQEQAEQIAGKLLSAFDIPLRLDEQREVVMSLSIGISLYPEHGQTSSELLKRADIAMYQVKGSGRRAYQLYFPWMDENNQRRATLAGNLRKVLLHNELSLVYQPRYSLAEQRILSVEALLRWHSPEFGLVPPDQFIQLAEETGMILEIGEWVLHQTCSTLQQWRTQGIQNVGMSVNISAIQLQRGNLAKLVGRILDNTHIPAQYLELELTESAVMTNVQDNVATLRACRDLGISLAIDDFGTGYSSLAYLKRLPINTLKIDREFITDLDNDPDDDAITSTIITMGHSLGLDVVAEGVETRKQLDFLKFHHCDQIQGYLVSQALNAQACSEFIKQSLHL